MPRVAQLLRVDEPIVPKKICPIAYMPKGGWKNELKERTVPAQAPGVNKAIVELGLPADFLVVLIARGNDFVLPSGGTVLEVGDTLLVLSEKQSFERVTTRLGHPVQHTDRSSAVSPRA